MSIDPADLVDGSLNTAALVFLIFTIIIMVFIYYKTRKLFHMLIGVFVFTIALYAIGNITDKFGLWDYGDGFGEGFALFTCAIGIVAGLVSIVEHKLEKLRNEALTDTKSRETILEAAADASLNTANIATELAASASEVNSSAEEISATTVALAKNTQDQSINLEEINRLTEDIRKISKMITNISEQTNLLALNASIEAGRAGESGRGFAVVAEKVQKLAEESKISVEKTNDIVATISQKIDHSAKVSKEISRAMEEISSSAEEQTASMEEITATANKLGILAEELKEKLALKN